jgi:hypothetical protein
MCDSRGADEAGPTIIKFIGDELPALLLALIPSGISGRAITGVALSFGGNAKWLSIFAILLVVYVPAASTLPFMFAS